MRTKKNVLFIICFLMYVVIAIAQKKMLSKADNFMDNFSYSQAISLYSEVIKKYNDIEAKIKIAECYKYMNNYIEAERRYAKIIDTKGLAPIHVLNYALVLKSNGKYKSAKEMFLKYNDLVPYDKTVQKLITSCDVAQQIIDDSLFYNIDFLPFNTYSSELTPAYYNKGIAFLSDRKNSGQNDDWIGNPFTDLYYVEKYDDKTWSEATPFPLDVNSPLHEGPIAFNSIYNVIYITRSNPNISKKSINRYQIVIARKIKNKWEIIEEFPFNSSNYSVGHPALSHDQQTISKEGKKIYFVSDMPGGYGGSDIYVSYKKGYITSKIGGVRKQENMIKWSQPENLGPNINSEGDELYPFIHPDGTLYFSSNGHIGLGGFDMYYSKFIDDGWIEPKNLGYPLNSSKNDFCFITNKTKTKGYFSSNRKGRGLNDDIYSFEKVVPHFTNCDTITGRSLCITLSEANTADIDTSPFLYQWALGDGSKKMGEVIDHCYAESGTYTISLNIIDTLARDTMFDKASYEIIVEEVPNLYINSPDTIMINTTVQFESKSDIMEKCNYNRYYWTISGVLRTIEGKKMEHSFNKAGIYYIRLGIYGPRRFLKDNCFGCVFKKIVVEKP